MSPTVSYTADKPRDIDLDMSAVEQAARSVLIETVTLCVIDGQRRVVGLLELPEGGSELANWLETDVPMGVWRGWLVTGAGDVVWLPGAVVH